MSDIKLYNGDCLEVMNELIEQGIKVDAIITDPPYTTPTVSSFGRQIVKKASDFSIQETYMSCLRNVFEKICKSNAPVFIFCDDKYYPSIFRAFYEWLNVQMIIWDKQKIGMGKPFRKRHELIVYANREPFDYNRSEKITHYPTIMSYGLVTDKIHPAQKPVDLISDLILGFTNEGGTVLDCFMGSGTTGVACKNLNRNFIGIELDRNYFEIAKKRIESAEEKQLQLF